MTIKTQNRITLVVIILVTLGVVDYIQRKGKEKPPPTTIVVRQDKSPEMQEKRLAFIKELVSRGVFSKVENINKSGHPMPNVWVGSTFYGLEFDEKKAFLGAVYAYYFDGTRMTDTVYLMDRRSGKEVGRFNSGTLEMY